jgi:hypothetical protein
VTALAAGVDAAEAVTTRAGSWSAARTRARVAEVAWLAPQHLSAATTRSIHWPALQQAGLV